jgi:3-keto-5-aminohexanoate cleavage enzyme
MNLIVIAIAITGSIPRKKDNPAVPILPSEQVENTREAYEAGATLVHIHVRNDDETSSSDPERFQQMQEGVNRLCPGMIVQFSTGGRGCDPSRRGGALYLKPDMALLTTASVKFPTIVYENHTSLVEEMAGRMKEFGVRPEIEIFDLSHLHWARRLADRGLLDERPHIQFVMGVHNALPAEEGLLDILLNEALGRSYRASIGLYARYVLAAATDARRRGLQGERMWESDPARSSV